MLLITVMTGSYCCLWFIPMPDVPEKVPQLLQYVYKMNDTVYVMKYDNDTSDFLEKYNCHWSCAIDKKFDVYMSNSTYISTVYVDAVNDTSCSFLHMNFDEVRHGQVTCTPKQNCNLLCFEDEELTAEVNDTVRLKREIGELSNLTAVSETSNMSNHLEKVVDVSKGKLGVKDMHSKVVSKVLTQGTAEERSGEQSFYMTAPFWFFVVLMCVGTVAFNVANCIGDAVCFDVLGKCTLIL